jgi:hypothetical protein
VHGDACVSVNVKVLVPDIQVGIYFTSPFKVAVINVADAYLPPVIVIGIRQPLQKCYLYKKGNVGNTLAKVFFKEL